jgi:hypothetical protein
MDGFVYDDLLHSDPLLREFAILHPAQNTLNSSDDPLQKSLNVKDLEAVRRVLHTHSISPIIILLAYIA